PKVLRHRTGPVGLQGALTHPCLVLPRVCRDASGEVEREDPGGIVLAVAHDDRADDLVAFHEFVSAVGHVCFAPPTWAGIASLFRLAFVPAASVPPHMPRSHR